MSLSESDNRSSDAKCIEPKFDVEECREKLVRILYDANSGSFDDDVRKKSNGQLNITAFCRKHKIQRVAAHKKLGDLLEQLKLVYLASAANSDKSAKASASTALSDKREHEKVLALCRYYLLELNDLQEKYRNLQEEAARLRRLVGTKPRLVSSDDR